MSKTKKELNNKNPYDLIQGLSLVSRKNKHIALTLYATECNSYENFDVHMKKYYTKVDDCKYREKDIEDLAALIHLKDYCNKIKNRYDAVDALINTYKRNSKMFKLFVSAFDNVNAEDDIEFVINSFM